MKKRGFISILSLCLAAALLCSGCRESHKFEQVIYTQRDAPVDEDNDTKINDNQPEHEEKDEDLSAKDEDEDSHTERDQEETAPVSGAEDETPEEAPETQQEENSVNDIPPADPAEPPRTEESIPEETPAEAWTELPGTEETPAELPASERSLRQVVDAYGAAVDVPSSVERVTAVGAAAQFVLMLGGAGRLAAASGGLTQDAMARSVFASRGLGETAALWYGDGSYGIADESFETLLELRPDVCFVVSGTYTFSDAQLERLAEAEIARVTLPKLNTPGNIRTAARIVGEVLGDRSEDGGTNAPAVAEAYAAWYDGVIARVGERVRRFNYNDIDFGQDRYSLRTDTYLASETDEGLYTLYIEAWDAAAGYRIYSDNFITLEGTGVAVAPSGYSTTPLSYHMSVGGVVNTAAAAADQFRLRHWYVNPLQSSTRLIELSGSVGVATDQQLTAITDAASGGEVYLGEARFPAIVVENAEIRDALLADAAAHGLWTDYGIVTSSDGRVSGYGFSDEIGQFVSTNIRGEYGVYVIPRGVGSWSAGTPESPLAALWTAAVFYNAFSYEELVAEVQSFYGTFYGYPLSDAEAYAILEGT